MKLNKLSNPEGSKKSRKRVGRGIGSGSGKTCGRGVKGQKSRSGVAIKTEGGQMPIIKRLPKRGFNCSKSVDYTLISLKAIDLLITTQKINVNEILNKESLVKIGYIKSDKVPVKLLGGLTNFEHKLTIELDACSASAKQLIESSGSKISLKI